MQARIPDLSKGVGGNTGAQRYLVTLCARNTHTYNYIGGRTPWPPGSATGMRSYGARIQGNQVYHCCIWSYYILGYTMCLLLALYCSIRISGLQILLDHPVDQWDARMPSGWTSEAETARLYQIFYKQALMTYWHARRLAPIIENTTNCVALLTYIPPW